MLSPTELYPVVETWLRALGVVRHLTAQAALAQLVAALLLGQSLRPAALARTLLSPSPVPARQRYKRVARAWDRPWLSSAHLTPGLVRAALALVPPDSAGRPTAGLTHLAFDSVRCGPWEVLVLGVAWHGRVLPVGWAVLPYPWPKQRFTPTACALVRRVAAAWPVERPAHLGADRGFPSRELFKALRAVGWGWTVRLRARSWVSVAGQGQWARALLAEAQLGRWTVYRDAAYGSGAKALPGTLVVGRGLPVVPWHQRDAGSQEHRAKRYARRQQALARKHRAKRGKGDASPQTDAWVILFTSHPTWRAAQASYRRRWAIEGSFRDAQGGWDGQHGWDLEPTVATLADPAWVDRTVGLWAVGALLQSWLGDQLTQRTAPTEAQRVAREWTVTGRLSVWARGKLVLTEPHGWLRAWAVATLAAGAAQVAGAVPEPVPVVALPPPRVRPLPKAA